MAMRAFSSRFAIFCCQQAPLFISEEIQFYKKQFSFGAQPCGRYLFGVFFGILLTHHQ